MGSRSDGVEVVRTSGDASRKPSPLVNAEQACGVGGSIPTDETRGPSMASPRLIPVPDSPQLPVQLPPESQEEDTVRPFASFGRNCVPSQAPIGDNVN